MLSPTAAMLCQVRAAARDSTHLFSCSKSNQVSQCWRISDIGSACVDMYWPYVHSSTTQSGLFENNDGVIHGWRQWMHRRTRLTSRTNL